MEVGNVVTVDTGEAHLVVDVLGESYRSHELTSITRSVTGIACLIHRRGTEEGVLANQAAAVAVGSADVTLSTGCVAVHTVQVPDLSKAGVRIVQCMRVAAELNQGVGKSTDRVVQ